MFPVPQTMLRHLHPRTPLDYGQQRVGQYFLDGSLLHRILAKAPVVCELSQLYTEWMDRFASKIRYFPAELTYCSRGQPGLQSTKINDGAWTTISFARVGPRLHAHAFQAKHFHLPFQKNRCGCIVLLYIFPVLLTLVFFRINFWNTSNFRVSSNIFPVYMVLY